MMEFYVIFATVFISAVHGSNLITQDSECSRSGINLDITGPGFIFSPGFQSGSYPPLTKCYWSLKAPSDKYVELSFVSLDLEKHINCGNDYVILSSTENDVQVCGNEIPPRFLALGSQNVEVAFSSNQQINRRGFQLQYKLLDAKCSPGFFVCRNLRCVPETEVCDNVDNCKDGSDEEACSRATILPQTCGHPTIEPELGNGFRIVGGTEAVPGSWPWQVSIQHNGIFSSGHFCGGALVNNFWIITAAHCLRDSYKKPRVVLGRHNMYDLREGEIVRYIDDIHVHPDYNEDGLNDIVLAKLNAEVQYSDSISPVCLPKTSGILSVGSYVHITGWGETKAVGYSGVLKQVMVPVYNHSVCEKVHSSFREVGKKCFCTGYSDQVHSACVGDSGGPVVAFQGDKWVLSGVVSWGSESCNYLDGPSVNTNVLNYLEWIKYVIN